MLPNPKTVIRITPAYVHRSDPQAGNTEGGDHRAPYGSATGQRTAGPYVGYELHLAVQTRDVRWTNGIDRTTLGPEVPTVITTCNLVPAGSHRADSIVSDLIAAHQRGIRPFAGEAMLVDGQLFSKLLPPSSVT
jgi:hypothetical protein